MGGGHVRVPAVRRAEEPLRAVRRRQRQDHRQARQPLSRHRRAPRRHRRRRLLPRPLVPDGRVRVEPPQTSFIFGEWSKNATILKFSAAAEQSRCRTRYLGLDGEITPSIHSKKKKNKK